MNMPTWVISKLAGRVSGARFFARPRSMIFSRRPAAGLSSVIIRLSGETSRWMTPGRVDRLESAQRLDAEPDGGRHRERPALARTGRPTS